MTPVEPSGPRKWILVVEDHGDLRRLWIEVLEAAGYAAVGSGDGLEAAELLRDLLPHLIVLDLRMPRASGWDLLETLRRNVTWHDIPVLAVSAHLDEGPDLTHTSLNIVGRMQKPVPVDALLKKIREVLAPNAGGGRLLAPPDGPRGSGSRDDAARSGGAAPAESHGRPWA